MSYKLIDLHSKEKTLVDRESSKYWNDETLEKNKAFNVIDLGFDTIEFYLFAYPLKDLASEKIKFQLS